MYSISKISVGVLCNSCYLATDVVIQSCGVIIYRVVVCNNIQSCGVIIYRIVV